MKALPFILAGLFFLSAASCGLCKKNKAENTITATQTDTTEKTGKLIVDKENPEPASADYTISSISIDGNILTIDVSFSGGCEEHFFNLYFNGNYKKSIPPKVSFFLQHELHNDVCRSIVEKKLKFDISASQYPGQQEMMVSVRGFAGEVSYKY